ncbi:MAG TPA: methylcobamide--CoM methyltransferase [Clostridiaceae bacterium]|jgi:uroporphyrinogen decarboxylase|nr:methylcobamide--CoM methyltransferase [Clostridiaceae bacterium]
MIQSMKKWILNLSNSIDRYAMPLMTFPGLELANRTIMDITKDGKAQFECIKALAERYPSIGIVTVMDLSVEAEAFGSPITFSDEEVPTVSGRIIHDRESAEALKVPKVGDGRTPAYIMAAELASKNIKDRPVFGGQIGPFSLAGRLYDMMEIMIALFIEPETVHIVLEKVTSFLIEYAKAYKAVGANGIIIAEPAAGLLSPEQCEEFSSQYVKKIVDEVQDDYFMVILHNCGNTNELIPFMLSTGAMGFHFGNSVDLKGILPQIPWGKLVFGNIDPAGLFKNGSKEDMKNKTWELLEETAIYKNFVISSGCDIPPGTPIENIDAFFKTLDKFNSNLMRVT